MLSPFYCTWTNVLDWWTDSEVQLRYWQGIIAISPAPILLGLGYWHRACRLSIIPIVNQQVDGTERNDCLAQCCNPLVCHGRKFSKHRDVKSVNQCFAHFVDPLLLTYIFWTNNFILNNKFASLPIKSPLMVHGTKPVYRFNWKLFEGHDWPTAASSWLNDDTTLLPTKSRANFLGIHRGLQFRYKIFRLWLRNMSVKNFQ